MEKVYELLEWLSEKYILMEWEVSGEVEHNFQIVLEFPMDVSFFNSTAIKEFGSNFFYTLDFCINVHLKKSSTTFKGFKKKKQQIKKNPKHSLEPCFSKLATQQNWLRPFFKKLLMLWDL